MQGNSCFREVNGTHLKIRRKSSFVASLKLRMVIVQLKMLYYRIFTIIVYIICIKFFLENKYVNSVPRQNEGYYSGNMLLFALLLAHWIWWLFPHWAIQFWGKERRISLFGDMYKLVINISVWLCFFYSSSWEEFIHVVNTMTMIW